MSHSTVDFIIMLVHLERKTKCKAIQTETRVLVLLEVHGYEVWLFIIMTFYTTYTWYKL